MQPNFSFSLYRSKPNKCASACTDTFLATTPIRVPPRSRSAAARSFNGGPPPNQILPENTSNIYGGLDATARRNQKKMSQEWMVCPVKPDELFVSALSNRAPQDAGHTRRSGNGPPARGKGKAQLLNFFEGLDRPDRRALNFGRLSKVVAGQSSQPRTTATGQYPSHRKTMI